MTSKGMTWDAAADRKLLLGILKMQNVSVESDAMAKYMSTEDQVCTASAIQNRVKKLKAMAKDEAVGGSSGGSDEAKPNATPRKRGATGTADGESPTKKGKGGKGNVDKEKTAEGNDGDDEETLAKADVKQENYEF